MRINYYHKKAYGRVALWIQDKFMLTDNLLLIPKHIKEDGVIINLVKFTGHTFPDNVAGEYCALSVLYAKGVDIPYQMMAVSKFHYNTSIFAMREKLIERIGILNTEDFTYLIKSWKFAEKLETGARGAAVCSLRRKALLEMRESIFSDGWEYCPPHKERRCEECESCFSNLFQEAGEDWGLSTKGLRKSTYALLYQITSGDRRVLELLKSKKLNGRNLVKLIYPMVSDDSCYLGNAAIASREILDRISFERA
jgi:hypothetical protein